MTKKFDDALDGLIGDAKAAAEAEGVKLKQYSELREAQAKASKDLYEGTKRIRPMVATVFSDIAAKLKSNKLYMEDTSPFSHEDMNNGALDGKERLKPVAWVRFALSGEHQHRFIAIMTTASLPEGGSTVTIGYGYVYHGIRSGRDQELNLQRVATFDPMTVTEDALADHVAEALKAIRVRK